MAASLAFFIGILIAFVVGLLSSRKTSQEASKVTSLTNKINGEKKSAIITEADADQKMKEYQDALNKYDPNFYNDDGSGGKPSA